MKKQITERQIQVLQLMADGYKEEDIASKLGVSYITIRSHKTSLYKRLGVNNAVSAVITAIDLGMIKLELASNYRIERLIEFKSEYLQSGITILNYFSTILRQKNPDSNSIVRIEQDGLNVRLLIIPEKGDDIQIIEKTLEEYGLVISGKKEIKDFLADDFQIMGLENKLEISKLELRFAQKQLEYERHSYREKLANIEDEVKWLRAQIGNSLSNMRQITTGNNDFLIAILNQSFSSKDKALLSALDIIKNFFEKRENEDKMLEALETVKKKNPAMLETIKDLAQKTISTASGRLLYDLICTLV